MVTSPVGSENTPGPTLGDFRRWVEDLAVAHRAKHALHRLMASGACAPDAMREGLHHPAPTEDVALTGCSGFSARVYTTGYARLRVHFDNDANPVRLAGHVSGVDRIHNASDPAKFVEGKFAWNYHEDMLTGEITRSGAYYHIVLPGYEPVSTTPTTIEFDAGRSSPLTIRSRSRPTQATAKCSRLAAAFAFDIAAIFAGLSHCQFLSKRSAGHDFGRG